VPVATQPGTTPCTQSRQELGSAEWGATAYGGCTAAAHLDGARHILAHALQRALAVLEREHARVDLGQTLLGVPRARAETFEATVLLEARARGRVGRHLHLVGVVEVLRLSIAQPLLAQPPHVGVARGRVLVVGLAHGVVLLRGHTLVTLSPFRSAAPRDRDAYVSVADGARARGRALWQRVNTRGALLHGGCFAGLLAAAALVLVVRNPARLVLARAGRELATHSLGLTQLRLRGPRLLVVVFLWHVLTHQRLPEELRVGELG